MCDKGLSAPAVCQLSIKIHLKALIASDFITVNLVANMSDTKVPRCAAANQ